MYLKQDTMGKTKNIKIPIFAIDFEGSSKLGIVEYGIVEIFNGAIMSAKTAICSPKEAISKREAEFFDISNSEAQKHPPFAEVMPMFCECRKRGIFMAHNAVVEDSFLRAESPSAGIVPDFLRGGNVNTWAVWLDTCVLMRNIFPNAESVKLSECIKLLKLQSRLDAEAEKYCPPDRRKWHCALYDAIASALILIAITELDGFADVNIEWLARYSGFKDAGQMFLF